MRNLQVKRFDDYLNDAIHEMNDFIKDKEIVEIKQSVLKATTGDFYPQYLVIYKAEEPDRLNLEPKLFGKRVTLNDVDVHDVEIPTS